MADKIPFNPFPTTGEDEYNQPSSRNIAPIINFQRGGLADRAFGYKSRFVVKRTNSYVLQVLNTAQFVDAFVGDINGNVGYINIGDLLGVKSPFIFIPDIYSVSIGPPIGAGTLGNEFSLSSWNVLYKDLISNETLIGNSPSNPNSNFGTLSFEIILPFFQYDDFAPIHDYLNFLNNIGLGFQGALFNNANAIKQIDIQQTLVYRMEQIPA